MTKTKSNPSTPIKAVDPVTTAEEPQAAPEDSEKDVKALEALVKAVGSKRAVKLIEKAEMEKELKPLGNSRR